VSLAVTGVGAELRELGERIPDIRNVSVGGQQERLAARMAVKDLVLSLRRIDMAVADGRPDAAMAEYRTFALLATFDVPVALKKAEPWSLFDAKTQQAYYDSLKRVFQTANRPSQ
jgi:hypothetical protein